MKLKQYLEHLDDKGRMVLLGYDTTDVRHRAFPSKRVVHAGLMGEPIPKEQHQQIWRDVLRKGPDEDRNHALYVHIPFCETKCIYCGFYQHATKQEVEDRYIDVLLQEIERDTRESEFQAPLDCIFIGGGTPTSLSPRNAERLLTTIHERFRLAPNCEFTFEGRIHDLVPEKMKVWKDCGINRISLGIQSFDTVLRQRIGRIDSQEVVLQRLEEFSKYDITTIVDLIYGLPGQTMDMWMDDIDMLFKVPIHGMDLYQLNIFPGGALEQGIEKGSIPPCTDIAGQADMYRAARQHLLNAGVERLSLCHWRFHERERSVYNTMAKTGAVVYPFGCGAGGNVGGITLMEERTLASYMESAEKGDKPIMVMAHQVERTLQEVADTIISGLEQGILPMKDILGKHERLEELRLVLDIWEKRGLITRTKEDMYHLTPDGEFWYVSMTQSLLECAEAIMDKGEEPVAEGEGSSALERVVAEMMPNLTAEERKQMIKRMPAAVRMMVRHSSYDTLKSMLAGLPVSMREKMFTPKR